MKRFTILGVVIFLLTILSACSSHPSLKLMNSNVSIVNDKSKVGSIVIAEGNKNEQELVPTTLYYEFTIKNTGNKSIGDVKNGKELGIKIEPSNKLVTTSKEVMGFNIFDPSSYAGTGVGYGYSFVERLSKKEEGYFTIHYNLGVSKKNSRVPLMAPSADKLKDLQGDALDASLVVMLGDTEIARFDLKRNDE